MIPAPSCSFLRRAGLAGLLLLLLRAPLLPAENWPCWRGPRHDGTSLETSLPTRWGPAENIAWKTPVPGEGHSSPVVWEDRVFLTSALADDRKRLLLAFDRRTGRPLWQQTVLEAPLEAKNNENSYASATPATDGDRLFVSFLDGSDVLVSAWDVAGKPLWQARPGRFKSQWGFSHSPVLFENSVLLVAYSKGENFVAALDRADGHTVWKTVAENPSQSYSQPLLQQLGGRVQLVAPGNKGVTSYDPRTGRVLWKEPMGLHHASPVVAGGRVYFLNDDGVTHVVKAGPEFELVARNELGEPAYASPAISRGQLFLRGFRHLYAIGQPAP